MSGIGRASAILASGTIVSRILGFLRAILITVAIGNVGFVADAYNQATFVPNSIYALIGGGLLTAVLVPQIIRASTGPDAGQAKGKVDSEVSIDQAYQAARSVGLQILATARQALGSLDRITKTVKVLGMVNSDPGFEQQPQVINGCSDLLVEVLGEAGRHTRSAVGFAALPNSIAVEIEATFEVE